jgi:hypothetical protein
MAQHQHRTPKSEKRAAPRPRAGVPHHAFSIDLEQSDAALGARVKQLFKSIGKNEELVVQSGKKAARTVFAQKGARAMPLKRTASKSADTGKVSDEAVGPLKPEAEGPLKGALERARARGVERAAEILAGDEMLNGDELGQILGISRQAIDKRRKAGDLIALQGPARGYKYPRWQISSDGFVLDGIHEVLDLCDGQAWTAYRHLISTYPDNSGETLYTKLKNGLRDEVLSYVESLRRGNFT